MLDRFARTDRKMIAGTLGGRSKLATPQDLRPQRASAVQPMLHCFRQVGTHSTGTPIDLCWHGDDLLVLLATFFPVSSYWVERYTLTGTLIDSMPLNPDAAEGQGGVAAIASDGLDFYYLSTPALTGPYTAPYVRIVAWDGGAETLVWGWEPSTPLPEGGWAGTNLAWHEGEFWFNLWHTTGNFPTTVASVDPSTGDLTVRLTSDPVSGSGDLVLFHFHEPNGGWWGDTQLVPDLPAACPVHVSGGTPTLVTGSAGAFPMFVYPDGNLAIQYRTVLTPPWYELNLSFVEDDARCPDTLFVAAGAHKPDWSRRALVDAAQGIWVER